MRFLITPDALDPDAAVQAVAHENAGAVVTFEGRVRRQSRSREVVRLEYEAYAPMAVELFERIDAETQRRWKTSLAIHHRMGSCAVGVVSVVIVAAAAHRAEAFDACRFAIEQLKADAPIWKKEIYTDGEFWVGQGS
jgi:molybdopterin synthase catalytic subunit